MSYIQSTKKDLLDIVKYPILTEKTIRLIEQNQYSFAVDSKADKLAVNVHSCVNASAQYAALEALNGPQDCVTKMNNAFKKRSKINFS